MRKIFFCFLSFLILCTNGCGYTMKSNLPAHVKTIYVTQMKSDIDITSEVADSRPERIYRPGIESSTTKSVINRFIFDGNLKLASKKDESDLYLEGTVTDLVKEPLIYNTDENIEEYRIKITAQVFVKNTRDDSTLWEKASLIGTSTYRTIGRFHKSEAKALKEAIDDLARQIVETTIEGW